MTLRRKEIEAFVQRLVVEIVAAEVARMTVPQTITEQFNARGVTTRKGCHWTGATVQKYLSGPGAKHGRSGENRSVW